MTLISVIITSIGKLRLAVAPLAASARMELRHPREDTAPIAAADVVIERDTGQIETGGDERLAGALLKELHKKLFG